MFEPLVKLRGRRGAVHARGGFGTHFLAIAVLWTKQISHLCLERCLRGNSVCLTAGECDRVAEDGATECGQK